LPGTNTRAYYESSLIADKNGFVTLVPGVNVIKSFSLTQIS